jgi:signal transduction histidine kinase
MKGVKLTILNPDGLIVSSSRDFRSFFGCGDDMGNKNIRDLLVLDIETIDSKKNDIILEKIPLKSSTSQSVDLFIHPLKDAEKNTLAFIVIVNGTKKLLNDIEFDDENLCHLDRLTHIGQLSASIAHEIRNPLAGIQTTAKVLRGKLDTDEKKEYIDVIVEEIARLEGIIKSLLDFARPGEPRFSKIDLKEVFRKTLFFVNAEIGNKRIRFIENYPSENALITADPEQLRQAFLNIMLNAIAAVSEKGEIVLTVEPAKSKGVEYYCATLKDNGTGMLAEDIGKIFKPFYTTKAKGLGLGLCVTKKIIEDHSGFIEVESQKGKGTEFRIYLAKES